MKKGLAENRQKRVRGKRRGRSRFSRKERKSNREKKKKRRRRLVYGSGIKAVTSPSLPFVFLFFLVLYLAG